MHTIHRDPETIVICASFASRDQSAGFVASAMGQAIVRGCDVCFSLDSRRWGSVCDGHLKKAMNDVNTLRPLPVTRPLITGAKPPADNASLAGSSASTDAQAPSDNAAESLETARAEVARRISVIEQAVNHADEPDRYAPPDLSPLAGARNLADVALLARCKESERAIRQAQRWHMASEIADNGLGWMFVAGAASLINPSAVVLSPFICLLAAIAVQGREVSAIEKTEEEARKLKDARIDLEKTLGDIDRQLEAVALHETAEALHKRLNPSQDAPPPITQTEQTVSIGSIELPKRPNGDVDRSSGDDLVRTSNATGGEAVRGFAFHATPRIGQSHGYNMAYPFFRRGTPNATAAPSNTRFREQVAREFVLFSDSERNHFIDQASPLMDERGDLRSIDWIRLPDRRFAIAVAEEGGAGLYTWDGHTLERRAEVPGADLSRRSQIDWLLGGSVVMVNQGQRGEGNWGTALVNVATGHVASIPRAPYREEFVPSPDGSRLGGVTSNNQLWTYDSATAKTTALATLQPAVDWNFEPPTLCWTRDGQQAIVWYRPEGDDGLAVHFIGLDGRTCKLPRVDSARVRDDVLEVSLLGHTRELPLPLDIDAFTQEDWIEDYSKALETHVLGGSPQPTAGSGNTESPTVERSTDYVNLGGVRVPVRAGSGVETSDAAPAT